MEKLSLLSEIKDCLYRRLAR